MQSRVFRRLTDLVDAKPLDTALENLLEVISAKADLSARLDVFEHEASRAGEDALAVLFKTVAASERAQLEQLLDGLRRHLNDRSTSTTVVST